MSDGYVIEHDFDQFEQYRNEDLDDDQWDQFREELQDLYTFYLLNPSFSEGVNYALWINVEDREYQVLTSNTGGFVTFSSASKDVGDGLKLTDEFFDLLGTAWHESMCFMPHVYFERYHDEFESTVEMVYGGNAREYEVWLAETLVNWMNVSNICYPELRPLAIWADGFSEFDMRVLSKPMKTT